MERSRSDLAAPLVRSGFFGDEAFVEDSAFRARMLRGFGKESPARFVFLPGKKATRQITQRKMNEAPLRAREA
jgi:hypothetical protein